MERKGIDAFQLKLLAVIFMIIDHVGVAIVFYTAGKLNQNVSYGFYNGWATAYTLMRTFGRLSYPVFAFFIVEGFYNTRSRLKYAGRLLIFAFISEVPFDYALMEGSLIDFSHNNVFWTLFLGLVTIWAIDEIRRIDSGLLDNDIANGVACGCVIIVVMAIAYFAKVDYGFAGVGAIVIMYVLRDNRILSVTGAIVFLGLCTSWLEYFALPILFPIYFYNGEQGKYNKWIKWGFYAFYPLHLLLLGAIASYFGLFDNVGHINLTTQIV